MTQEEIKSRNTAIATYMGWKQSPMGLWWHEEDCKTGESSPPPFHEDMNLLMPVVWKLQKDQGYQFMMDLEKCLVVGGRGSRLHKWVDVGESPALALWEAVSSLVMELQQKAV